MTIDKLKTESETATGRKASVVERLVMRCATCKYWQGDKEKAIKMFNENPVSMDLYKGWPNDGNCGIEYEWLNTEVSGDAAVYNTVDANFGCIYWGA